MTVAYMTYSEDAALLPSPARQRARHLRGFEFHLHRGVCKASLWLEPKAKPPTCGSGGNRSGRRVGELRRCNPFKRVRRLEFAELPKTISGKIRRVELRATEAVRRNADSRGTQEFWEEDFAELR